VVQDKASQQKLHFEPRPGVSVTDYLYPNPQAAFLSFIFIN
jgi:hypothetical protein